jgi:hypothetical protein
MRRLALLLLLFAVTVARASAQAVDTVFVGTRHSPIVSGLVEFVLPTAGFAYAGDWTRGFLPNAFRVAALIGFGVTADGPEGDVCEGEGACQAWGIAVLGTTVWSIVGAVQTANDHNRAISDLEGRLFVEPAPVGGVSVGFRLAH